MSTGMTLADDHPVDPDDELLVAYLDGELDTSARDAVEQRLLDDESLRSRLHSLQSGWNFLDDLPDATSSEKLVESTLELVVADIIQKSPRSPLPTRSSRKLLLAICCVTLLGGIGAYGVTSWMRTKALEAELADLTLAENLDAYLNGNDLMLMRDLFANPNFERMVKASREVGMLNVQPSTVITSTAITDRPDAIKELPVGQRSQLESRWDVLQRMPVPERDAIRKTADAVAAQSDPQVLLETMTVYAAWSDSLSADVRGQIEQQQDKEKRRAAISRAIDATFDKVTRYAGRSLDDDTSDRIYFALEQFAKQRFQENPNLEESVAGFVRQFNSKAEPEDSIRFAIRQMVTDPIRGNRMPTQGFRVPPITDAELLTIIDVLSDEALDTLDVLSNAGSFNIRNSLDVLSFWANESVERHSPFRHERRLLIDQYNDLDPVERDAIDLLPPEEFKRILDRLSNPRRPFRRPPPPR